MSDATTTPAHTYMMRSGADRVFASTDNGERGKLRRRGWQRVSTAAAARTLGNRTLLASAVATCQGGEIERISELGEIRIICHGHAAAETNAATDWEHSIDKRSLAAARLASSVSINPIPLDVSPADGA